MTLKERFRQQNVHNVLFTADVGRTCSASPFSTLVVSELELQGERRSLLHLKPVFTHYTESYLHLHTVETHIGHSEGDTGLNPDSAGC